MTLEENRGQVAFSLHRKIVANEAKRRELFAENATLLTSMLDKGLYRDVLGDNQAPWSAYLGEVEVFYSRNEVSDMIRIYKKFTGELHIIASEYGGIPRSRLIDIISFVTSSNYIEWFGKAETLTGRDWLIEVRKEKGLLTEEDEHTHDMVNFEICSLCGKKHKLNEE